MKRIRSFGAAIALVFASLLAGLLQAVTPVLTAAVPAAALVGLSAYAPVALAQDLSDYSENKLIDHLWRGTAFTNPSTIYFGLSTTACSDSSFGTEVSGGSYTRVGVTPNSANFANTQASGSGASTGTGGQTSNLTAITFPAPTANWTPTNQIGWFFWADASTSGNLLGCRALTTPKSVNNGDAAPAFATGAFTFTLQ